MKSSMVRKMIFGLNGIVAFAMCEFLDTVQCDDEMRFDGVTMLINLSMVSYRRVERINHYMMMIN